jgi:hypothetical protein
MADTAQLKTLIDTVAQLRADFDARNNEVAALQDNLRDRDRAIQEVRDHIKDQDLQEKQLRQQIELLEGQLKAVSLPGGVATHVASTVTGVTPSTGSSLSSTSFSRAPTHNGGGDSTGTTITSTTPASTMPAAAVQHRRVHRIQPFKMGDDIESFISRFEWSCMMDHVTDAEKAGNLILTLDPKIFAIIDRELDASEKLNYDTLKRHLLKRFDIYKEAGLRRVLFTTMKREVGETQEDYYSRLLEVGNKAFTEENALTIDRMIRDQFVVKNDDKTRLYLIEKAPKTAKEALSLAISFQAALSFNDAMKDSALTVATVDVSGNEPDSRVAGRGDTPMDRRDRSSSRDRIYKRNQHVFLDNDRQQSDGRYHDSSRGRYSPDFRDRFCNDRDRDSDSERRSSYSSSRYANINYGSSRYCPDPTDRSIGRGGNADYERKKLQGLPTAKDSHGNSGRPPQRYLNSELEVNGITVNLEENSTTSTEEDGPNQRTLLLKQRALRFKKRRISSTTEDTLSAMLRTELCSRTFNTRCLQHVGLNTANDMTGQREQLWLSGMFTQACCCARDSFIATLTPSAGLIMS